MSQDPYHAVQREIQTSLQTASTLRASYLRIRSTARDESEELVWARNELKATLAAMEADLEDLEESVKIVEETGPRMFDLEESDVMERRGYVNHVKREIETIRSEIETGIAKPRSRPSSWVAPRETPKPTPPTVTPEDADEDAQSEWARAEQQMMIREQDRTIDSIAGTLNTLAQQAGLMGREIGEHNEMLDDIEQGVDHSGAKLDNAMKRMRKFIRDTEETKSSWCIIILIVILMALLLAVILV